MDRHAAHTRDLLDAIEYPDHLRDVPHIAAWHHEKLDGSGPMGVQGDAIPLATRIIAVADVFDALVSPRVYKAPMTPRQALDILERGRGADWDGVVIDALHESLPALLELVYGLSSIDDTGFTQAA